MKPSVFSKVQNELEQYRLDAADTGTAYAHTRVNKINRAIHEQSKAEFRPEQDMKNGEYTPAYLKMLANFNLYKRLVVDGEICPKLERKFLNDASNEALQRYEIFVSTFSKHIASEYGSASVATLIDRFENNVMRMKVEFDDRLPVYFTLKRDFSVDVHGFVKCEWNFQERIDI